MTDTTTQRSTRNMSTPDSSSRIYTVTDKDAGKRRLVRAISNAQAVRHCSNDRFQASVSTQDELAELLTGDAPVAVEDATKEPQS